MHKWMPPTLRADLESVRVAKSFLIGIKTFNYVSQVGENYCECKTHCNRRSSENSNVPSK